MPTQRPRHTITETDDLARALARVRAVRGLPQRSTSELLGELALRGAQAVLDGEEERAQARERLIDRLRELEPDRDAAAEVRGSGWFRP